MDLDELVLKEMLACIGTISMIRPCNISNYKDNVIENHIMWSNSDTQHGKLFLYLKLNYKIIELCQELILIF